MWRGSIIMKKILFGAGKVGQRVLDTYKTEDVLAFCDNNIKLHGTYIQGKKVISFEELCAIAADVEVIICSSVPKIAKSIVRQLSANNIKYKFYNEFVDSNDIGTVFTKVYSEREWGAGEEPFYSGSGSHDVEIISPYIELLTSLILNNDIHKIVEVGCGDFFIMNKVLLNFQSLDYKVDYTGIDVVDALIKHNIERYSSGSIHFMCADASKDGIALPDGELLIIRQVLQHLDNESISNIMNKTQKSRYILVTEHIYEGDGVKYNLDKSVSENIRLNMLSGVYLDKPPYSYSNIVHLLKIPSDGGVIRTSLIVNDNE